MSLYHLLTILDQIAKIINSRPLTLILSDKTVQVLTTNHFLCLGGSNVNTVVQVDYETLKDSTDKLKQIYTQ